MEVEELLPPGEVEKWVNYVILFCVTIIVLLHYRTWADSLPFEIPFGFATTFKSDEDWLDDWEELEEAPRK